MPICWTRPRCLPRRKASAPVTSISPICRWPGLAIRCSRSRCTCMSGSPSTSRKSRRRCAAMCARSGRRSRWRRRGIFKGYYKQPEESREAITEDGWLRTGDAGFVDKRGHLAIIDRAKDVGRLYDGTSFAPQFIENKLKFSPYVGEAVVFGHDRSFVAAMVAIDAETVGKWAERHNLPYTSFQDLCSRREVLDLIGDEIRICNAGLPGATRIRRFVVLNKAFDPDDDEITRTRKIRRRFVTEKYAAVLDACYSGEREVELRTESTFEDGRKSVLQSRLAIGDVDGPSPPAAAAARRLEEAVAVAG